MQPSPNLGPLRFERIALEKLWGGRALERTPGIALPGTRPVGETWEVSDRAEHNSVVALGPERGVSLRELMRRHGDELLGSSRAAPDGSYPLLVKFIDASQPLSIQVHPHERTRRAGEEKKTEFWHILAAEPGARLWLGLAPGVTRERLAAVAARREIVGLVREWPVHAGDSVFVPAGTVHAIGGGITLVEIQENADPTHRLYDWDRVGSDGKPRALQVEDALRTTRFDAAPPEGPRAAALQELAPGVRSAELCECAEFSVELVEAEARFELDTRGQALVLVALAGAGRIRSLRADCEIGRGDTWLVPAALGRLGVEPGPELRLLIARAA